MPSPSASDRASSSLQWVHGLVTVVMWSGIYTRSCVIPLQWVHGLVTVVMANALRSPSNVAPLQWVHGLVTVVMLDLGVLVGDRGRASMGPRSGNRGYGCSDRVCRACGGCFN